MLELPFIKSWNRKKRIQKILNKIICITIKTLYSKIERKHISKNVREIGFNNDSAQKIKAFKLYMNNRNRINYSQKPIVKQSIQNLNNKYLSMVSMVTNKQKYFIVILKLVILNNGYI